MALSRMIIVAAVLAVASSSNSPVYAQPATIDYVVQAGDSCVSIAAKQLGSGRRYKEIHQLNPNLGAEPHKLLPGRVLKLPNVTTTPEANLTKTRGQVQVRRPLTELWAAAFGGMDLFRAWRVGSLDKSSAEVKFVDSTAMHMRENTVVIIYGPTVSRAKTFAAVAELESGALETRLAQAGNKPASVLTPSSIATLQSGNSLIVVDDRGTSWVGNHAGGSIAVQSSNKKKPRGKPVKVDQGMGSKVVVGKLPDKPRPLPPAPQMLSLPSMIVSNNGSTGVLKASWQSGGPSIARYRAVLRDSQQADMMVSDIAGSATSVEFVDLPLGTYSVELAAIDNEGFESIRGQQQTASIDTLQFTPSGAKQGSPALPSQMAVGSTVTASPHLRCAFGNNAVEQVALASAVGPTIFRCESAISSVGPDVATGEVVFERPVEIMAIKAVLAGATPTLLKRNSSTMVHVTLTSSAAMSTETLTAVASDGATAKVVAIDQGDVQLEIELPSSFPDAQQNMSLQLSFGDHVVDELTLGVAQIKAPALPPQRHTKPHLELGGFVGGMVMTAATELGDAATRDGSIATGPALGARFAAIVHPRLLVEAEVAMAPTGYAGQPGAATVLSARAQLAATAIRDGRYQLRILGGAGSASLLNALGSAKDDTDVAIHGGAAFVIQSGNDLWFRVQAIDQIFAAPNGGYANVPEITFGLSTRIGW
jgi:hypothetical protein